MFRNKLSHIKNEDELFKYFSKNAKYSYSEQNYMCAGITSDDTSVLFKKLRRAWIKDKKETVKYMLNN
jgi:hypothetical protein